MRATRRACLFTLALGKTAPAAEIPCRTVVPLSDLQEGAIHELGNQAARFPRRVNRAGQGNSAFASAPVAESEQHDEQIVIVNKSVVVHIRRQVRTARAEVEEHL